MVSEKKQEFTRRISQANSTEMVVILYDIALEYINNAKEAIGKNDYEQLHLCIGKIQGAISELCESLNYEYELAGNLRSLYSFCIRRVGICEAVADSSALDDVIKVLAPLRDAYSQIVSYNTQGPVMGNSQQVYAGLTYGRDDINESYVSQNNRGFLV